LKWVEFSPQLLNNNIGERMVSQVENVIKGEGEASRDGGKTWVHDFSITYTRIE
jgi:hypothetical protein